MSSRYSVSSVQSRLNAPNAPRAGLDVSGAADLWRSVLRPTTMIRSAAKTDVGRKRDSNEDSHLSLPEYGLFVVADGVGGRACGEIASAMTIEVFKAAGPKLAALARGHAEAPSREARAKTLQAIDETCQTATRKIYERAELEGRKGMTTTLVVVLVAGSTLFLAHVGDSRAYLFRGGMLHQLTEDHSMVNELVRTGKMTPAEARASKHRHVITRAIGLYPSVQPSLATVDLIGDDRVLLCTDGLCDVIPADAILACGSVTDPSGACQALVQEALDSGGPDNITVMVVDPGVREELDAAENRARILETLFLFEDLPYAARVQVADILGVHAFSPGQTLVQQGAREYKMFVVLEGEVSVRFNNAELARLGSGEHFGELSLVDRQPRSASVVAVSDGVAISISAEELDGFLLREPALGAQILWKLMRVLGQRLRDTNARVGSTLVD